MDPQSSHSVETIQTDYKEFPYLSFGSNLRQILPFPTHKCMIIYGTFCLVPYLSEQPHRMMVNTTQHIQLVHISAGNTDTLGINIFSL